MGSLPVTRKPNVAILVTGDELVEPGTPTEPGQIYDSNGPMLEGAVQYDAPSVISRGRLPDDLTLTKEALAHMAETNDLILISGGASVGDHDHIPRAVAELGIVHFHKVSIKPGKPILFGQIGNAYVFGLPGNPGSSFVCYQIFVRQALLQLAGRTEPLPRWLPATYSDSFEAANRDEFVRVALRDKNDQLCVEPVAEQGSFGLLSLSRGEALARLSAGRSYKPGDPVSIMILPK
jgi:molybdopterin molybdotransferase